MSVYREYWKLYGGINALIKSRYLWIAFAVAALSFRYWTTSEWWELVITVVPSVLGFSLGGYAIFLAFGDRGFQELTARETDGRAVYTEASATFFHFILTQVAALVVAITAKSLPIIYLDASNLPEIVWSAQSIITVAVEYLAFTLFIYSLLSALAASAAIFKLSLIYHQWLLSPNRNGIKRDEK